MYSADGNLRRKLITDDTVMTTKQVDVDSTPAIKVLQTSKLTVDESSSKLYQQA
jgi:hypothetical protein